MNWEIKEGKGGRPEDPIVRFIGVKYTVDIDGKQFTLHVEKGEHGARTSGAWITDDFAQQTVWRGEMDPKYNDHPVGIEYALFMVENIIYE